MRAYRGLILNPRGERHCVLYADGLLVVNDAGQVGAVGPTDAVARRFGPRSLETVESVPAPVIVPAFTDIHLHWVQNRIKGSANGQGLLPWLEQCVWPEETRFAEAGYTREAAAEFFHDMARHGTMAAAVYSSVHEAALEAFVAPFGHFLVGNALMTRNAPSALCPSPDAALDLTDRWAARLKAAYAVSPRFAPACSFEVMQQAAQIALRHGCFVQTHLAEALDEVAWVHRLFPDCRNYAEVYQRAGLLGPRTILGHCIYLDDDELAVLKAAGAVVAHCPLANESLGSGRMPIERIQKAGIRWALASDVAAGPSLSMWEVMRAFLRVHAAAGLRFTMGEAFYRATLAGAEALGVADRAGNLDVGKEANFVLLDAPGGFRPHTAEEALAVLLAMSESNGVPMIRHGFFRGNRCFARAGGA